ncbi:MAG: hypothetical protein ACI82A_003552 [Candidatus Azotimanducaceae bacterium]
MGRQVINLDDEWHIGAVGFRQNQQTFDGIGLVSKPSTKLSLYYAQLRAVNTILGRKAVNGRQHLDSDLFNAQYQFNDRMSGTVYHYRVNNEDVPDNTHNTSGIRFSAQWPMAAFSPGLSANLPDSPRIANKRRTSI